MKPDNLDRILATDEDLAPSSGFVASVMERVREGAAAPRSIPFPWKRTLLGMTIAAAGLAWCTAKLVQAGIAEMGATTSAHLHFADSIARPLEGVGWAAAVLGVSLLSWLMARRMIGRSGLF